MPMPDPQLLFAFIKHYYDVKVKIKTTTVYGAILSAGQTLRLIADHAEDRKPKIEDITKKITNASTAELWLDIALECGEQAEEGQAEKTWEGDCDYAKVMHAMRAYIIAELMADPKLRPSLEAAVQRRLLILDGDSKAKDENLRLGTREMYHSDVVKGYDLYPATAAYKKSLLELANLGQLRYCSEAVLCQFTKLAFYDPLKIKKEYKGRVNPKIPICYQPIYHILYYLDEGLKASTAELPGNVAKKEMPFSTYITFLKNHTADAQDVIAAELFQGDGEGHDFPDEVPVIQSPPPRQTSKGAVARPAAPPPPLPSNSVDGDVSSLPPPPKRIQRPSKPAGQRPPTLFSPPTEEYPLDGSSPWQTRPPVAPLLFDEEKDGTPAGSPSRSLSRSGDGNS